MVNKNFLAKNLFFLRNSAKLKQHEIQDKLGIKRNTWSNWENEKSEPSLENLLKISDFFNVNIGDLVIEDFERQHTSFDSDTGVHEERPLYQKEPCTDCLHKEEVVNTQKQTIAALQGQIEALQMSLKLLAERELKD